MFSSPHVRHTVFGVTMGALLVATSLLYTQSPSLSAQIAPTRSRAQEQEVLRTQPIIRRRLMREKNQPLHQAAPAMDIDVTSGCKATIEATRQMRALIVALLPVTAESQDASRNARIVELVQTLGNELRTICTKDELKGIGWEAIPTTPSLNRCDMFQSITSQARCYVKDGLGKSYEE